MIISSNKLCVLFIFGNEGRLEQKMAINIVTKNEDLIMSESFGKLLEIFDILLIMRDMSQYSHNTIFLSQSLHPHFVAMIRYLRSQYYYKRLGMLHVIICLSLSRSHIWVT